MVMETINLSQLRGNSKNPRSISKHDFENLKQSIDRFGDLSGVVFNVTTQQLVGGHQRVKAFEALQATKQVVITKRYDTPTPRGTVAVGYVTMNGELYSYREVQWDADFEKAANIAANRIQGEFDKDLLAEMTYEISQLENSADLLNMTGMAADEIDKLLSSVGAIDEPTVGDDDVPVCESCGQKIRRSQE
jgi:hypothetical protein